MAEKLGHIALNRAATFKRRKRRGGRYSPYKVVDRDYEAFRQDAAQRLRELDKSRRDIAERYAKYGYTPTHIFILGLTQNVPYAGFKTNLESVDIETISAMTGKPDHWAVAGGGDHASRLDRQIERRAASEKPTFIDAIATFGEADPNKKIGMSLRRRPIKGEFELVDVEVWRLDDDALDTFTEQLFKMVMDNGGRITDTHKTRDTFVVQLSCNAALLAMVATLREVVRIDRPMQVEMEDLINSNAREIKVAGAPGPGAPGILVADSGAAMHPALTPAFGGLVPAGDGGNSGGDDTGHGTGVAGIALYGDVKKCIDDGEFKPEILIYVAKVLEKGSDGDAVFTPLVDTRIERAVEETARMHPRCRVVNLSLGDASRRIDPEARQHRLGGLVDHLSAAHPAMMFTISAGNNKENMDHVGPYPDYLLSDAEELRLMDPAASAHAITVGALSRPLIGVDYPYYPSPDTCTGPGLNRMVKPDVVEVGGGYHGDGGLDVVTLNANFASDDRPFTMDRGTSMSAPAVAHMLAMLQVERKEASRNLLKALVISSASIPASPPSPLGTPHGSKADRAGLLRIYGYGKPDLGKAMHSRSNRALFVYDGKIHLDEVALFAVYVPKAFWDEKGRKTVEVTLVYDPPTDSRAGDYFGVGMEYHLYNNVGLDMVRRCYEDQGNSGDKTALDSTSITGNRLNLYPGISQRKKSLHQKSYYTTERVNIGTEEPLVLAVMSMSKWIKAKDYEQGFALALALSHSKNVDIYTSLRSANVARVRAI